MIVFWQKLGYSSRFCWISMSNVNSKRVKHNYFYPTRLHRPLITSLPHCPDSYRQQCYKW
jgi:hypothetical protein